MHLSASDFTNASPFLPINEYIMKPPSLTPSRQMRAIATAVFAFCAYDASLAASEGSDAASTHAAPMAWCAPRCDQVVIDWSLQTWQVIKTDNGYADPMAASRALAMVHLAMHDAVNAAQPRYRGYAYAAPKSESQPIADSAVAAAVAAHDVLVALYPMRKEQVKHALAAALLDAGKSPAVEQGRKLGAAAAAALLARRANDGSSAKEGYQPGTAAGAYRYTPGFEFLAAPHWRGVTPFSMSSPSQFRVTPPPALTSAAYAQAFEEVKRTGSKAAGPQRSEDQTNYAAYWYEFSEVGWNRIARSVARGKPQDLWQRARTFALLNAAMADAYVAGWDSKMHHNFWRPVTAIRLAAEDGNPQTQADAGWEPLLPTPPVQDHPSTHSALGAAAAAVLANAFGSDQVSFTMASQSGLPHASQRRFASFSAAARENADSRVRAGIHFRFSTEAGLKLGEQIGQQVSRDMLPALN